MLILTHHQETCLQQWGKETVAEVEPQGALGLMDHQLPFKKKGFKLFKILSYFLSKNAN